MILSDMEALASMVNDPKRPIQFVFAGKAHPMTGRERKFSGRLRR
jgi:glucan phosphorylase